MPNISTQHGHKKQKDSRENSLVVLFTAELEFRKILVPRLLQNLSTFDMAQNKNNCTLYVTSFLEH